MTKYLPIEAMMPIAEEKLAQGGEVSLTVTGTSMLPVFRNRKDSVTLVPPVFPLKRYDIPFYKRSDGRYVLHRIVRIKDGNYIIRGDNCHYSEIGITDNDIIGVVSSFCRGGKRYTTTGFFYKLYCAVWSSDVSFFIRKTAYLRLRSLAGRAKRKVVSFFKKH